MTRLQELWNHTAEVLAEMDRRFAGTRFRYAGTGTDHLVEVAATDDALARLSVRDYALVKALFRFLAIDEGWPEVADPDWPKFQFVAEPVRERQQEDVMERMKARVERGSQAARSLRPRRIT